MSRLTQDLQRRRPITIVRNQHYIVWEPLAPECPITAVPAEESQQLLCGGHCIEELVFVGLFGASSSRGNMYLIPQYARCLFRMQHRKPTNNSEIDMRISGDSVNSSRDGCLPGLSIGASQYLQQPASEVEPPWRPLFCSLRSSSNS